MPPESIINVLGSGGSKKIALKISSEKELLELQKLAKKEKLNTVLIRDGGLTQVDPGTKTALAIGPDLENKIDKICSKLKLF